MCRNHAEIILRSWGWLQARCGGDAHGGWRGAQAGGQDAAAPCGRLCCAVPAPPARPSRGGAEPPCLPVACLRVFWQVTPVSLVFLPLFPLPSCQRSSELFSKPPPAAGWFGVKLAWFWHSCCTSTGAGCSPALFGCTLRSLLLPLCTHRVLQKALQFAGHLVGN